MSCQWGALDVDTYGDGPGLVASLNKLLDVFHLTAYVEASKSGGAHVYFLLDKPVPAAAMKRALGKLAVWLGVPDAELRPTQTQLSITEGDLGTMMVLPGFGAGKQVLDQLAACVMTVEAFNKATSEGEFIDAPPCIFPSMRKNQAAGWKNRNQFLYQVAVFYRYRSPASWEEDVRRFAAEEMTPALPENEVTDLINQLRRVKECHYSCKKAPFDTHCVKNICQARNYGIATREGVGALLQLEGLTVMQTDPPTWFVDICLEEGKDPIRLKLTTGQLQSAKAFQKRCLEVAQVLPTMPTQKEWEAMVAKMLKTAVQIPVPEGMDPLSHFADRVARFVLSSYKTYEPKLLLSGRVLIEHLETGSLAHFRMVDFEEYMHTYRQDSAAIFTNLKQLQMLGKLQQGHMSVAGVSLEVWTMQLPEEYLELTKQ